MPAAPPPRPPALPSRVVLLGPPGSGKGTQASRLADASGASHIASGDLLRAEVERDTKVGKEVRGYLDRGELVPDEVLLELVLPRISEADRYLLDGFPRSLEQARALADRVPPEHQLQRVLLLEVPRSELIRRMRVRAAEQGRSDDTDEVFERRLQVYDTATRPLIDFYRHAGLLVAVAADADPDAVFGRLQAAL